MCEHMPAPTPLQPVPRLARALGISAPLWVKRDDLCGPGGGGNKVRKLAYLLADAARQDATTLVTLGAAQSNHARLTAILGSIASFEVHLVLGATAGRAPTGNLLLDSLAGATIHPGDETEWSVLEQRWNDTCEELRALGRRVYAIPLGGSSVIGALGYARAYEELCRQLVDAGVDAGWIVHASSTGGTQAGLVAGHVAGGRTGPRILGVDVAKGTGGLPESVPALTRGVLEHLGADAQVAAADVVIRDFTGPRYGAVTEAAGTAIVTALRSEGLIVDPVYSSKALAAIAPLIAEGAVDGSAPIVFLHTGGVPALFSVDYAAATLRYA
jgi:L-cysteate sulfo-lyase